MNVLNIEAGKPISHSIIEADSYTEFLRKTNSFLGLCSSTP